MTNRMRLAQAVRRVAALGLALSGLCFASLGLGAAAACADTALSVTYLRLIQPQPPVLSNLDARPEDLGLAGARLALKDNRTTGRFLGQSHDLHEVTLPEGTAPQVLTAAAMAALQTSPYLILDMPAEAQQAIADLPQAAGALLFNAAAADDDLRGAGCRANLFHTLPSYAMRADALMQFAQFRRWKGLVMLRGAHAKDQAFAAALDRSATKFGLEIAGAKDWVFDADMRRNASQEVPLFTQDLPAHDLMLIADETGDFGRYIAYNTWLPRPVAGSEGLRPTAWAPVVEQWGAAQLQSRFTDLAGRDMAPRDYAAWAAFRALGEAVTRTKSADPAELRNYILSDAFELAGFKGRPLSFRSWNGQLRQPIPLVTPRAVVAQAPLPGFLHQRNEMDSLGQDAPETQCTAFQ